MRVLLIRHGQSEGNVDQKKYIEKGDQNVGLTDNGWRQAIAAGEFLKTHYADTQTRDWPYFFLSAYQRTHETLSGIMHGLGTHHFDGEPTIHHDPRLIEQFYGAVPHLVQPDGILNWKTAADFNKLSLVVRQRDDFTARPLFGESGKDVYLAVQSFMDSAMHRTDINGHDDMVIVCHGHVIREFIRAMGALPMTADIANPGNCDIIEARGNLGHWSLNRIYDGQKMQPVHEPILKGNHKFGIADLPPVPVHLTQGEPANENAPVPDAVIAALPIAPGAEPA